MNRFFAAFVSITKLKSKGCCSGNNDKGADWDPNTQVN